MSDALTEVTQWGCMQTEVWGYVGIDTLQEQIRKKALKRGFEFNILVVGRSGLGKSTLVNTLFKSYVSRKSCTKGERIVDSDVYQRTTQIKSVTHMLEEKGVRLCLTVTDTPGFGDQIDNENCWQPIQEYIYQQYEKYLEEEMCVARKKRIIDTRIHCCLYFISPTGHWLTPLDIEFMKRLDKMVNVVPVIAKADAMTIEERAAFKETIRKALERSDINVYPMREIDEDEDDVTFNNQIRDLIPFAVVGSDKQFDVNGKMVYGRKTGWGIVEVENKKHCEFSHLRDMLIRTHMQDLIDVTRLVHYEKYRREKLTAQQLTEQTTQQQVAQQKTQDTENTPGTESISSTKKSKPQESKFLGRIQQSIFRGSRTKNPPPVISDNVTENGPGDRADVPSRDIPNVIGQEIDMDSLNESSL